MRVTKVSYRRNRNLGNYEHEHMEVEVEVGEGDSVIEAMAEAKYTVTNALGYELRKSKIRKQLKEDLDIED